MTQADPPDDRSPLAEALSWSSVIISIALEMVLPGLFGYWIDQKLGTVMIFLVAGLILGVVVGMMHLVRMANAKQQAQGRNQPPRHDRS